MIYDYGRRSFGENSCYYPIQAVSFLATFATYDSEDLPPQPLVAVKRAVLHDDIRALSDAVFIDRSLEQVYYELLDEYEDLIRDCLNFSRKIESLFAVLPAEKRSGPIQKTMEQPHPSLYAVAYLVSFGTHVFNRLQGDPPKPTDEPVETLAKKMLEDMTRIAAQAGLCESMRNRYTQLQNSFDEILNSAVVFTDQIEVMREEIPSLV